ncbi:hypothetical protein [Cetobacterium sp. SF1]|uniref:hypothetical protein n=1 Tax=Cetobacterium sp. SF1 TaxID=3417654 RepID=UPI003CE8A59B
MQNNFFQTIIFDDTKETLSYFKIIECQFIPREKEELIEISDKHMQNYIVDKIIYNIDICKIDFVNIFLKDIHFKTSENKKILENFFHEKSWNLKND